MHRRTLELTPAERQELERTRDRDARAYLRERAAALLKVADGQSASQVAFLGLHKPRKPETLYRWLDYYQVHRTLKVRPACRGCSGRSFSP